jgi:hypothetical protein
LSLPKTIMKKIAQTTIDEIRNHVRDNPSSSYKQVAASFGISEITVKRICADLGRGKSWRRGRKQTPWAHDKFWSTVDRTGNSCWEWRGSLNNSGYGFVYFDGKSQAAHRVAYALTKGPIAEGFELDHRCRNRACCNPDHLEPVTREENMRRVRSASLSDGSFQHPAIDPSELYSTAAGVSCASEKPALAHGRGYSTTDSTKGSASDEYFYDPLEEGHRKHLEDTARLEAEDRQWGLTTDQLGVREIWNDKVRTFTISNLGNGIVASVPARSAKFAEEMFESVWGYGYDVAVYDNEIKIANADTVAFLLSTWRDRLQEKYTVWESSEEGRRCIARVGAEKLKRILAEDEERRVDQCLQEQWELQLAERMKKEKFSKKPSGRSRSVCRTCGKRQRDYDVYEMREAYPDEAYLEELESGD